MEVTLTPITIPICCRCARSALGLHTRPQTNTTTTTMEYQRHPPFLRHPARTAAQQHSSSSSRHTTQAPNCTRFPRPPRLPLHRLRRLVPEQDRVQSGQQPPRRWSYRRTRPIHSSRRCTTCTHRFSRMAVTVDSNNNRSSSSKNCPYRCQVAPRLEPLCQLLCLYLLRLIPISTINIVTIAKPSTKVPPWCFLQDLCRRLLLFRCCSHIQTHTRIIIRCLQPQDQAQRLPRCTTSASCWRLVASSYPGAYSATVGTTSAACSTSTTDHASASASARSI